VAARPSIIAATDESLTTGFVISAQARPMAPFRAATDPRIVQAVRRLSERLAAVQRPACT
jgi:hypothetical protein